MELLIPGLILVALMVYASTRIKRSAARAFERELIEGDGFLLEKPEGFLHKVNSDEFLFEAYSREFGIGVAEEIRAATAVVEARDSDIEATATSEQERLTSLDETEGFELNGAPGRSISGRSVRDGHEFRVREKLIEAKGRTLVLRAEVLAEQYNDFARRIDEMISSFEPR